MRWLMWIYFWDLFLFVRLLIQVHYTALRLETRRLESGLRRKWYRASPRPELTLMWIFCYNRPGTSQHMLF